MSEIDLKKIADEHGALVTELIDSDFSPDEDEKTFFKGRSFIVPPNKIIIGIYKDNDMRIASFFHELGHFKDNWFIKRKLILRSTPLHIIDEERRAWRLAFDLAHHHGITFPPHIIAWSYECLGSYVNKYLAEAQDTIPAEKLVL